MNGNKIVIINDIIFKGKRGIDWKDVEKYLKQYVGEFYIMADSSDIIYIGTDFPDEFTGSIYTRLLRGAAAKAKANVAQALPELVKIATDKHFKENMTDKHAYNAKNGWYRYNFFHGIKEFFTLGFLLAVGVFNIRRC